MIREDQKIAIIGMSAALPTSPDINAYWRLLSSKASGLSKFSKDELLQAGVNAALAENPNYVPVKGFLKDADKFDAKAFGLSSQEATLVDPQFRIFLELVDQALHSAGQRYQNIDNKNIGLFAACSNLCDYASLLRKTVDKSLLQKFNQYIHTQANFLPMYIAYQMNFTGPAISVQTACSSSLVAVVQACESLLSGFCDLALAGGISLSLPLISGYFYEEGLIYSKDGACLPFSKASSGIVPGDGGGAVLLKRLDQALMDKDNIYAIIEGYSINNDGRQKMGYATPGYDGQKRVISAALARAELKADQIKYVEAHGTGTKIGDQIELEALKSIFDKGNCYLGSVKSSIGHTDVASGIAGLLKVALAFKEGVVPPMYGVNHKNADHDALGKSLDVLSEPLIWDRVKPEMRYAGISAFGIGGTNAHVIVGQNTCLPLSSGCIPIKEYQHKQSFWPTVISNVAAVRSGAQKLPEGSGLTDIKNSIREVCKQFFGQNGMTDGEDFLDYDLDSLSSVELAVELQVALGCQISPQKVFENSSVKKLADYFLNEMVNGPHLIQLQAGKADKDAIIFVHPGHGEILEYRSLIKLLSIDNPIYAIENNIFNDLHHAPSSLTQLAESYCELANTVLNGNQGVIVCGWSFGGTLAVELASQLSMTVQIKSVMLFDAWRKYNSKLADRKQFESLFKAKVDVNPNLQYIQNWLGLHWGRAKLLVNYDRKTPMPVPCVLFKASSLENEYKEIDDSTNHWDSIFGEQLEVVPIDASHSDMFNAEKIIHLAHALQNKLKEIEV